MNGSTGTQGNGQQQGLNGGGPRGGGAFFGPGERGAFAKCLPARMRNFRATITTPRQTLQQVLSPPQTNITSNSYTSAGVQTSAPTIGLVTAKQVTTGRFLRGGREALVSVTYAS